MLPHRIPVFKVEVIDLSLLRLTGLPWLRKRSLQPFFGNVEEITVLERVHTEPLSILDNFVLCRLVVFVDFFFENDTL
jgi:hypothetical protein